MRKLILNNNALRTLGACELGWLQALEVSLLLHFTSIDQMTSFAQDLDLSSNELAQLPAEVGELRRLERLNITNNKLTSLPRLEWCAQLKVCPVFSCAFSSTTP